MSSLRLQPLGDTEFQLVDPRLIIAGYTARDPDAVAVHIHELAAIGVPPPATVPAFYDLDPTLLTTDPVVEVDRAGTSGEVEPVFIRHAGRLYVGVGSDHTDRDLERHDIAGSKAACPKPLSPTVIPLPGGFEALDWDSVVVESEADGEIYQRGSLAALRTPSDLFARLAAALGDIRSDLVVFGGTLPLLDGEFVPATDWQLRMHLSPQCHLTHTYEAKRRGA